MATERKGPAFDAAEYEQGYAAASQEMRDAGWTEATARAYLDAVGTAPHSTYYGRGYDDAVRDLVLGADAMREGNFAIVAASAASRDGDRRARRTCEFERFRRRGASEIQA